MAIAGIQGVNQPSIIIQEGTSSNGFTSLTKNCAFGTVKEVYSSSFKYTVGDVVLFDKSNAKRFKNITTSFFVVDENDILFKEKL